MSSDNFRVCGTRKGESLAAKIDLLQLQTRGETKLSKEGKLAESGKFLGMPEMRQFQLKQIFMNAS
jgi:hypothetical protein